MVQVRNLSALWTGTENPLSGLRFWRRYTNGLKIMDNQQFQMTDSRTLMSEYVRTGSEAAFGELVARYLDLVYSSALRLVGGDAHLAEDVSQTVFLNLARKAHRLPREVMLGGWLHRDACYAAQTLMRGERRRQKRERQAIEMNAIEDNSESNLAKLTPLLDEAIEELRAEDRAAILLRFFEQRDFRSIGEALGSNEDAARKRVTRAVEKLHLLLRGRGMSLSVAALGAVLAAETLTAAPVGLAASLAATALAGASAGAGLSAALATAATTMKLQASMLGVVVLVGMAACVVVQHQAQAALRAQDESLRQQSADLARQQVENERLTALVKVADSHPNNFVDLVRLRQEVESLRKQTNSLAASLEQNQRLRERIAQPPSAAFPILQMREQTREWAIARMNYTRQWLLAFQVFASKNADEFPTTFDEARPLLPQQDMAETNLTTGQFEILYRGSTTNITAPSLVVLLREKQACRNYDGKWSRAYGFVDGHCEISSSPDGNFDAWEKRHIILPPTDR